MNLSTLKSLQARIREATGADRELNRDIANAFRPEGTRGIYSASSAPNYTTDPDGLGACVGLMRKVLPGWVRGLCGGFNGRPYVVGIQSPVIEDSDYFFEAEHALETHATLLAICAALIAEEEAKLTEKAG